MPLSLLSSSPIQSRNTLTKSLLSIPLDPRVYLDRAKCHLDLEYPDLAAGDAYKALELVETGLDQDYSDYGLEICSSNAQENGEGNPNSEFLKEEELLDLRCECLLILGKCCGQLGSTGKAVRFLEQVQGCLREIERDNGRHRELEERISDVRMEIERQYTATYPNLATKRPLWDKACEIDLPDIGRARREIYPWNNHEPDRSSAEILRVLNKQLEKVAPMLEVRSTALPILHDNVEAGKEEREMNDNAEEVSIQLGLFAKQHLHPGTKILHEPSVLTACRTLHSPLCDCCQSPLPPLSSPTPPVSCLSCSDTVFCSQTCLSRAQQKYHPVICAAAEEDTGLEEIGRDSESSHPSEDLYLLLLSRVIAMSQTQDVHPLDLPEIKYIWGDFTTSHSKASLPFSFHHTITLPRRILTALNISPFAPSSLERYDTWVFQTLYAKFRGVASAKQSTWDGKPEVAAVHPLWCLANHSCDPNIRWEWPAPEDDEKAAARSFGDEPQKEENESMNSKPVPSGITMTVRREEELATWAGLTNKLTEDISSRTRKPGSWTGIQKDQEILNHYNDIRLPLRERRQWARGALGGNCMCERCLWEERELEHG